MAEQNGVRLSLATMRQIFPDAPDAIMAAFVEKQGALTAVGLNQTRHRLVYCFANWSIAALPTPLNDWMGAIVGSLFIGKAGMRVISRLRK